MDKSIACHGKNVNSVRQWLLLTILNHIFIFLLLAQPALRLTSITHLVYNAGEAVSTVKSECHLPLVVPFFNTCQVIVVVSPL